MAQQGDFHGENFSRNCLNRRREKGETRKGGIPGLFGGVCAMCKLNVKPTNDSIANLRQQNPSIASARSGLPPTYP